MVIGELAGLGGSCSWATCSIFFSAAARRLGVPMLNFVRLFIALIFLSVTLFIWKGTVIPADAAGEHWFWLGISAVVGLAIGDLFVFGAFKTIGPRITLLLFTLAPPISAAGEWLVYNNPLSFTALLGMGVALAGVCVVISDRKSVNNNALFKVTPKGILIGVGGAVCQGLGLVLSKMGMNPVGGGVDIDPLTGTFMRMAVAAPCFAVIFFVIGGRLRHLRNQGEGLAFAAGGAFFGPYLGVTLSLVAAKFTHTGIAMTLLSTTPITVLPFARFVYKEKLTYRAVLGAIVAVAGVAILCLDQLG